MDPLPDDRRLELYSHLAQSPIWTDELHPLLTERFKLLMREIVSGGAALSEAKIRANLARCAEIDWLLALPKRTIDDIESKARQAEEEEELDRQAEQRSSHIARYGFKGPYQVAESEEDER